MSKLGVCIVGASGAVATTVIGGAHLMKKNLAPRRGMITEKDTGFVKNVLPEMLDLTPLEKMEFAGWDLMDGSFYDAALIHKVIAKPMLDGVKAEMSAQKPWPAVVSEKFLRKLEGKNVVAAKNHRDEVEQIVKRMMDFKKEKGCDRVVLVNLASTERYQEVQDVHRTADAFEKGLDKSDDRISPGMKYMYAAVKNGIPYVNFTPSLSRVPALDQISAAQQAPFCGMDGKTGQTLMKTTLAGMFRIRNLKIEGWYSTNFLGNNDGLVLDDPASNKTKIVSKASVLDSVVGYKVENHQVHIHYYKPRGDAKEAWDNIDLEGFLGEMMQLKINFLCKDSILAAPLIYDLVRLVDVAKRSGEKGIQRQLSVFFKSPYAGDGETPVHETFKQEQLLMDWAKAHKTGR